MVKVITIRDDVYASLYKIKRARDMSFSEVLEYLVTLEQQRKGKKTDMFALAGTVSREEVDRRLLDRMQRGF
ncbi:Putative antitoxin [uncultured archaeon]|nr:Putative antitoxin [uncultured archaeon]